MNHIRQHLTFVDTFHTVVLLPGHLAEAMHLRIDEISDIMSTIGPLEYPVPTDLWILEIASINEDPLWICPLFKSFSWNMALVKNTTNLDLTIINFLGAQTFDFIFEPLALIFLLIGWLLVFTLTMELSIQEIP